jgi:BON domain
MTDPMTQPEQYVVAHVRETLACDPRVNELNVQVTVTSNRILLSGEVTTAARRDAITTVARELLPDFEIINDTTVADFGEPRAVEKL